MICFDLDKRQPFLATALLQADGSVSSANRAWTEAVGENPGLLDRLNEPTLRQVLSGAREACALECQADDAGRWFLLRAARLPGDGAVQALLTLEELPPDGLRDAALGRQLEELARTARRLDRKNQELDEFAYITSHDLKAPLRGIANLARWIEEDLGERTTGEVQEHLAMMRRRVGRMEAMIDGILQYSRIGRVAVKKEPVDVGQALTEIVDLIAPPPGFSVGIGPGMPVMVTERVRLEQVFLNLLGNAVKHHHQPERGRVEVRVRDADGFHEFEVADDGPGIPPQYHQKVFVIFQTLVARDKVENTGVGLALVKKIVENQGGQITLESEEGKGAVFRFTWPKSPLES